MAALLISKKLFFPVFLASFIFFIGAVEGLSCYICGQYNDGVGSITPCINSTTDMHLKECRREAEWCIKYVSEGSTVRDCVRKCNGKESWSAQTYCCQEDGCNNASLKKPLRNFFWILSMISVIAGYSLCG